MPDRPILFSGPEEWRDIVGFEGRYRVSNHGRVLSLSTYRPNAGGILTPWVHNKGYQYVTLRCANGRKKTYSVHGLVLEAFVGPRPHGKEIAHWNGDPADNRIENLRWATAKENSADRRRHGRTAIGENNASAKLDRHVVKTIKRMKFSGFSAYETARLACVDSSTIQKIWDGELWTHI